MKQLALLIPGLDGTGQMYYRQVEQLEKRYRVIAYRYRTRAVFGYQDLVAELDEATAAEAPASILVVGESFGGTVAMHYVLAYPERVKCLALVNTFSRYRRRILIRVGCKLSRMLQWGGVREIKNFIVDRTLASEGILPEDRKRYRQIIKQVNQQAYCRRLELSAEVDLRARLEDIKVHTMIFASGRDKIVPSIEEARSMFAGIPDCQVYEFPDAGHALLLTPGFSLADYLQ